jgi:hypothetical protein
MARTGYNQILGLGIILITASIILGIIGGNTIMNNPKCGSLCIFNIVVVVATFMMTGILILSSLQSMAKLDTMIETWMGRDFLEKIDNALD